MATEGKPLQNFNLETMSGIYPGSRTMVYQRLRLHPSSAAATAPGDAPGGQWYQLQWYRDPDAAVLLPVQPAATASTPTITLADPQPTDFALRLHSSLAHANLRADACFICRHWQPSTHPTVDNLPAGRCRWHDAEGKVPRALATQSALSLACSHFERLDAPTAVPRQDAEAPPLRVPKSAELDPDRLPFWPRLWHRLRRPRPSTNEWTNQIIERSGVGAGTEPCFVCQGRLANLGAIAVASPEGDKQTLSIWRCRSCYTTYFNDWTDRWERLDNLETEERYYRIAPAEAYAALTIIHATKGGEHPGRRADRPHERAKMLALVADNQPLSHQVRQGR